VALPATENGAGEARAREQKIAEAAYFRAKQRNFEAGRELDDWLAAELEIDSLNPAHQESIDDANIIGPIP
jgi:nitrate reductase assembly molybdenum cofactor insertion protein NarJ